MTDTTGMTRSRLFAAAASVLALAAVPSAALAGDISLTQEDPILSGAGWSDQRIVPGETFEISTPFSYDSSWLGGTGAVAPGAGQRFSVLAGSQSAFPQPAPGQPIVNSPKAQVKMETVAQCGENFTFNLQMLETATNNVGSYPYTIPTGLRAAYKTRTSTDVGDQITEFGEIRSQVVVPDMEDGRVKGLKIHLGSLTHTINTRWLVVTLISPSGESVVLFSNTGRTNEDPGDVATLALTNLTFDDDASLTAEEAIEGSTAQLHDLALRPVQSLSAFNGESSKGVWILKVEDTNANSETKRGTRRVSGRATGRARNGEVVGQLHDWSMQLADANCAPAPSAWFGPDPLFINPAGGQTLDATGSVGADGQTTAGLTYDWDLNGNGTYEPGELNLGATPDYSAAIAGLGGSPAKGTRDVKLRVNEGATSTEVTRTVIVTERPVVGLPTYLPAAPEANVPVTITAPGAPTTNDPDGTITRVEWDVNGDGEFAAGEGGTAGPINWSVTTTWDSPGAKVVRVRVTDDTGATTIRVVNVGVANQKPTASFDPPVGLIVAGAQVVLDASDSVDPDGNIVSYEWAPTGSLNFLPATSNPRFTVAFPQAGTFETQLRVTDESGDSDFTSREVVVVSAPSAALSANNAGPVVGETVTFNAGNSSDETGTIATYRWDLAGNGSYGAPSASSTATKSFPNPGYNRVGVKVTSSTGATADATVTVLVRAPTVPGGSGGTPGGNNGGGGVIPGAVVGNPTPGTNPSELLNGGFGGDDPPTSGRAEDGFTASLSASSKQKAKKALKNGIAAKVTMNTAGKITVKLMLTVKDAKKIGIKAKGKAPIAIGSGAVVLKKAGTGKFVVKFKKKYAKNVKKAKAVKLVLRGVAASSSGSKVAVARKTVVKK